MDVVSVSTVVQKDRPVLLALAWAGTILLSLLPNVIGREWLGAPLEWLFWGKMGLLALLLGLTTLWSGLRPLRAYFLIITVYYGFEELFARLAALPFWQTRFGGADFTSLLLDTQLRRLAVALLVLGVLLLLPRRRGRAFLRPGDLRAPTGGVRWLGIDAGTSWLPLGLIMAFCLTGGTLLFLFLAGVSERLSLSLLLPLVPWVLLFAALNAFSEELVYRGALLAPLVDTLGPRQALLLTAYFFGMAHFYGVPYGIVGVLMAGFLGWLLGKSMLETRGMGWAWFIHFWQDVAIFGFMAVGAVVAGG